MRALQIVNVPSIAQPIMPAPGFAKKLLADYKLDLMGKCGFGCTYCSSETGNYQRINRGKFADLALEQLGRRVAPVAMHDEQGHLSALEDPDLAFIWPDVLAKIEAQIDRRRDVTWGAGKTLVFSMLTDAFSPPPLTSGTTAQALRLIFSLTDFRVRVLTKNSVVGLSPSWVQTFATSPDRCVVGLSTGTLDDAWAEKVERRTPPPSARVKATRALQAAGAATFGMLCPIFPDALAGDGLERLVDAVRPERCEHVWAEPYNDRANALKVRAGYAEGTAGHTFLTEVYERGDRRRWSAYAAELYTRLITKARAEGWAHKLRFLLYEDGIVQADASAFAGLEGVLLQSKAFHNVVGDGKAAKKVPTGWSANPAIRALQRSEGHGYALDAFGKAAS